MATTRVAFPNRHRETFARYYAIDFAARKQVHRFYADDTAAQAARAGKPLLDGSVPLVKVHSVRLDYDGGRRWARMACWRPKTCPVSR